MKELIDVLSRIAASLERLEERATIDVKGKFGGEPIAFPWSAVSVRAATAAERFCADSRYQSPLSCQDLMEIGHEALSETRNFGITSAREIADKLTDLGFRGWLQT